MSHLVSTLIRPFFFLFPSVGDVMHSEGITQNLLQRFLAGNRNHTCGGCLTLSLGSAWEVSPGVQCRQGACLQCGSSHAFFPAPGCVNASSHPLKTEGLHPDGVLFLVYGARPLGRGSSVIPHGMVLRQLLLPGQRDWTGPPALAVRVLPLLWV